MTQDLRIDLGPRSYDIVIGAGMLRQIGPRLLRQVQASRVAVVADDRVGPLYADAALASLAAAGLPCELVTFPAGEDAKSLEQLAALHEAFFAAGLDRKSCIVALGGGVTGDLAGFAAATFMRGIPLVQVPTSLLAMVDSSSGGKTGVNHPRGKNLIGAFHQPSLVLIDTEVLATLPAEELCCGLAEVVKHGMIRDAEYFELVEERSAAILDLAPDTMAEVIRGSCRIKGAVVSADEREAGLRAILNFGHTFGHAFEALSGYAVRHGEAVSMGMMTACRFAETCRRLDPSVRMRLAGLLQALGLPVTAPLLDVEAVMESMRGDKKTEHGQLRLVLPTAIGQVEIVASQDEAALRAAIAETMAS